MQQTLAVIKSRGYGANCPAVPLQLILSTFRNHIKTIIKAKADGTYGQHWTLLASPL